MIARSSTNAFGWHRVRGSGTGLRTAADAVSSRRAPGKGDDTLAVYEDAQVLDS